MKKKSISTGDISKDGEIYNHNVLLIDNLSYNLINVSQLCNRNLYVFPKKH